MLIRRPFVLLLLSALLCSAAAGSAGALNTSLHGSYKSYITGLHDASYQDALYGKAAGPLRLDGGINLSRSLSLNISYILTPQVSTGELLGSGGSVLGSERAVYRAFELPDRLYPVKDGELQNMGLYQELDRAFAAVYLPFGDLYAGRQAISWGSAHVINPTDIIAPYSFTAVDTEHKPGVDALRLRLPLGMMNEVDLGFAAGDELAVAESSFFARTKLYLLRTDISLLVMDVRENLMAGLDVSRSIGGTGSWLEAAWFLPDTFSAGGPDASQQYLAASAGLDYNFSGKLYGYAEYHYNGAGAAEAADYPTRTDFALTPDDYPAYTEGGVELLGRHYASLGGTYQLTPLLPVSALAMINLQDPSAYLSVNAEYNFTEGVYLTGGCSVGLGEAPNTASGRISSYRSEFGAAPLLLYSGIKVYF